MGAVVLADPGDGTRSGPRRRYVLPALLIAGWVGLFAYSAAYLTEDLPFRPQRSEAPSAETAAGPRALSSRLAKFDQTEAGSQRGTGETAAAPTAASAVRQAARPVQTSPLPRPVATAPDYVGLWGPSPAACGHPSRRRGYIPATITPDQARAGRTLCSFHEMHRSGGAWVTAAECSDRGRHWSSQVRLTVDEDHLTWSSSRGTVSYTRCNRRSG
ncbi:peptidase inhibitor family I36 protein [Methylobacterium sp. J-088]|uniref:peptidase inhibitor family I36 protein n=1 Tax=unclassified Methylobacterium TaxID=2615210 RepID=UPI001FB8D19E|nr:MULTISPECIES: peptidase inhibitor family I36 protein [unclassified Methylobacterium]MCJ2065708.1 peptidase inhibitor family I36 protein [Methylobacterium sp. J-088]